MLLLRDIGRAGYWYTNTVLNLASKGLIEPLSGDWVGMVKLRKWWKPREYMHLQPCLGAKIAKLPANTGKGMCLSTQFPKYLSTLACIYKTQYSVNTRLITHLYTLTTNLVNTWPQENWTVHITRQPCNSTKPQLRTKSNCSIHYSLIIIHNRQWLGLWWIEAGNNSIRERAYKQKSIRACSIPLQLGLHLATSTMWTQTRHIYTHIP